MKRILSLAFMLTLALLAQTQIVMKSFQLLPTDLTATMPETMVKDQNGKPCALIKVESVPPQTGFTFDAGMLGVRQTVQKVGEVWVYVPQGVKRLSVFHQQLGVLREQDLGQSVQSGKTYLMQITTGTVRTVVEELPTAQWVVFQLTPPDAIVELEGETLKTVDGVAKKFMKFGQYDFRVQAPDCLSEVGRVTVNDPEQSHVVKVSLRSNLVDVTIAVDGQAEIWVNGEQKGRGSWSGRLGEGTYQLEARLSGHRSSKTVRDITAEGGAQTIRLAAPTPMYGKLNLDSEPGLADIYIDGKKMGQTPRLLSQLLAGNHLIRLTRQGYQDYTATVTVKEGETANHSASLTKTAVAQQPQQSGGGNNTIGGSSSSSGNNRTFTVGGVSFTMVKVDGGTFKMGATSEQQPLFKWEKPVHSVTLSPYYIGETEVTQALWEAVMGNNPSNFKGSNRPVEKVSWNDCQTFISKLNAATGQRFRLPTEAEWEFAARGGIKSSGYQYSGSNDLGSVAWYTDNSVSTTHDVKTKQPNELGLYDMSGNVYEWCQDWYGDYSNSSQTNPTGPASGSYRVSRGGSWLSGAWSCRVADRSGRTPVRRNNNLGLRLALAL